MKDPEGAVTVKTSLPLATPVRVTVNVTVSPGITISLLVPIRAGPVESSFVDAWLPEKLVPIRSIATAKNRFNARNIRAIG